MRDSLLASSALILALLLLRRLFRRTISRRAQYALWALVLARLLVPASLPAADFSVLTFTEPVRERVDARLEGPRYLLPVETTETSPQYFPQEERGQVIGASTAGYTVLAEDGASLTTYALSGEEAFVLVWKLGVGVMACWMIWSNLRFWLLLRNRRTAFPIDGYKRRVFLVDEGLPSPCLFGLFRPAVYLTPAAAGPEALRYVLAHEEAHARHLDPLWALLRSVCLCVYWFDPLVWWAALASRNDCELACDEGALRRLGAGERMAYGRVLLSLVPVRRGNPMLSATTMTSTKKRLKERITRIAENRRTTAAALGAAAALAALVCAVTFTGGREQPPETADRTDISIQRPEGFPELVIPLTAENASSVYELDASGLAQFMSDRSGEFYQADYNGDGQDEYICVGHSKVFYCFQQDGVLYQMNLCALLADHWLDRWAASKMRFVSLELPEDGGPMTIHLRLPVPGSTADPLRHGFEASRYLVFDRDSLLVYRTEPETIDHVLSSVEAPTDVLADAKALGETGDTYHHNQYRQYTVWDGETDWRIVDVRQVEVPELDGVDVEAEVYTVEYEICGDTSVILAANSDVTLKEGGWAGGFANSVGWLLYQVADGKRVLLESTMSGYLEWNPDAFQDWYFVTLKANDLVEWPDSAAMQAFGAVLQYSGETFLDVLTGKRLTIERIGETMTRDERLWSEARVFHYTVIDLDRDGTPELVLSIGFYSSDGESYETGAEILRYENGEVRGYNMWYRAFNDLRSDGTFHYSGGASNSGWATLRFTEEGCVSDVFTYCYINEDMEMAYRVNGEDATEEEFISANYWQSAKPAPVWISYNDYENIRTLFGT